MDNFKKGPPVNKGKKATDKWFEDYLLETDSEDPEYEEPDYMTQSWDDHTDGEDESEREGIRETVSELEKLSSQLRDEVTKLENQIKAVIKALEAE